MRTWGRIGVLFVDQRGGRSFPTDVARPYLGSPQWKEIATVVTVGRFSQCDVLVVVTSVPLAYIGMGTTGVGRHVVDDLMDHWALPAHPKEQVEFIRALRKWKQAAAAGQREVIVVGRDVHVGGHTDIEHNGEVIFRRLISSPITNKPPGWFLYALMGGVLETNARLSPIYSFEHHDMTRSRNFGLVLLRAPVGGPAYVSTSLVTGRARWVSTVADPRAVHPRRPFLFADVVQDGCSRGRPPRSIAAADDLLVSLFTCAAQPVGERVAGT